MQIYAAYHHRTRNQQIVVRTGYFLILLTILISTVFFIKKITEPTVISPVTAHAISQTNQHVLLLNKKDPQKFMSLIENTIDDSIPEYSVIVDDFLTSFHGEAGDQIPYTAASVQKIPILLAIYDQIQKGKILKDTKITLTEDDRQDYGTGSIQYDPAGTKYTIGVLADKMIKESDNTAAYILARKVMNMNDIQSLVHGWGMGETDMDNNYTTNANMDLLFRKLFTGQLLNATYTREVIEELENSNYENRIPALLPEKTHIYHKEGTAIGNLHDVGVVMGDKSMYYIGIFTSNVSDEDRAERAMARISKAVYTFMQGD
jgi:beta-lactamase class A